MYHQAFGGRESAGRLQRALALDLHQADAACAFGRQRRVMAQDGDADARLFRHLQDRLPGLGLYLLTVNG